MLAHPQLLGGIMILYGIYGGPIFGFVAQSTVDGGSPVQRARYKVMGDKILAPMRNVSAVEELVQKDDENEPNVSSKGDIIARTYAKFLERPVIRIQSIFRMAR